MNKFHEDYLQQLIEQQFAEEPQQYNKRASESLSISAQAGRSRSRSPLQIATIPGYMQPTHAFVNSAASYQSQKSQEQTTSAAPIPKTITRADKSPLQFKVNGYLEKKINKIKDVNKYQRAANTLINLGPKTKQITDTVTFNKAQIQQNQTPTKTPRDFSPPQQSYVTSSPHQIPENFKNQLFTYLSVLKSKIVNMENTLNLKENELVTIRDNLEQSMQRELELIEEIRYIQEIHESNLLVKNLKREFKKQLEQKDQLMSELQPVIQNQNGQIKHMQDDICRLSETAEHLQLVIEQLQEELEYANANAKEEALQKFKSKEVQFYEQIAKIDKDMAAEKDQWEQSDKNQKLEIKDLKEKLREAYGDIEQVQLDAERNIQNMIKAVQEGVTKQQSQMQSEIQDLRTKNENHQSQHDQNIKIIDGHKYKAESDAQRVQDLLQQLSDTQRHNEELQQQIVDSELLFNQNLLQQIDIDSKAQNEIKQEYEDQLEEEQCRTKDLQMQVVELKDDLARHQQVHEQMKGVWYTRDSQLNEKIDRHRQEIEIKDRKITEIIQQHGLVQDQHKQVLLEKIREIEDIKKSQNLSNDAARELDGQKQALERQHDANLAQLKESIEKQHEANLAALEFEYKRQAQVQEGLNQETRAQHQITLIERDKKHEEEITKVKTELENKISELAQEYQSNLKVLTDTHETHLKVLKTTQEMEEQKRTLQADRKGDQDLNLIGLQQSLAEKDDLLAQLRAELLKQEAQQKLANQAHQADLGGMGTQKEFNDGEHAQVVQQLKDKYEELLAQHNSRGEQFTTLELQLSLKEAQLAELAQEHQARLDQATRQHGDWRTELEGSHNKEIESIKQQWTSQHANEIKAKDEEIHKLQSLTAVESVGQISHHDQNLGQSFASEDFTMKIASLEAHIEQMHQERASDQSNIGEMQRFAINIQNQLRQQHIEHEEKAMQQNKQHEEILRQQQIEHEEKVKLLEQNIEIAKEEAGQTVSDGAQAISDLEGEVQRVKNHYKGKIAKMNAKSEELQAQTVNKASLECQTDEIAVSQVSRTEAGSQFEAVKIIDAEMLTTLAIMESVQTETEQQPVGIQTTQTDEQSSVKVELKDVDCQFIAQVQDAECQFDEDNSWKEIQDQNELDVTSESKHPSHLEYQQLAKIAFQITTNKIKSKLETLQLTEYEEKTSKDDVGQTSYQEQANPTLQQYLKEAENKKHFLALSKLYGVQQSYVPQEGMVTPDAKVEASSAQIVDLHMFISYITSLQMQQSASQSSDLITLKPTRQSLTMAQKIAQNMFQKKDEEVARDQFMATTHVVAQKKNPLDELFN